MDKEQQALEHLQVAVGSDLYSAELHYHGAAFYRQMGNKDEATKEMEALNLILTRFQPAVPSLAPKPDQATSRSRPATPILYRWSRNSDRRRSSLLRLISPFPGCKIGSCG
jgi:hypothetical protein